MDSITDHSSDQLRSVSPESCVDESAQSGVPSRTAEYLSTKERITATRATNATVSPPELASVSRKGSKKVARAVSPASNCAPTAPQVYIRNTEEISALRGLQSHLRENRSVCPPNTRMTDFNRKTLIFVHNFVPKTDKSISPDWFFTLGETGKPNQNSWIMPFNVLGKGMRRYQPDTFSDDDSAVRSIIDKVILSNRMLFDGKYDWCSERTGDLKSYKDLCQLTDPIVKKFHENLCKKITDDCGDYRVILLGDHAWDACKKWFPSDKILNEGAIPHGSYIKNNYHYKWQRNAFASTLDLGAAFLSGTAPSPIDNDTMNTLLHVGRQKKIPGTSTRESRKRARIETPEETAAKSEAVKKKREEQEAAKLEAKKKREEQEAEKLAVKKKKREEQEAEKRRKEEKKEEVKFSIYCSHVDEKGKRCNTPARCNGVCHKHGEKCSHIDEKGKRCNTPAVCRGVCHNHGKKDRSARQVGEKCSHVDEKGKRCNTPARCRGVCHKHGEKCSHIDEKGKRCNTPAVCRGVCIKHAAKV
jgi:hypothetical protein